MLNANMLSVVMLNVVEPIYGFASCGRLLVEHLPQHPKVEVSSPAPATATGTGSENIAKKKFNNILVGLWHKINKLLE
jgi:hypothetical protein